MTLPAGQQTNSVPESLVDFLIARERQTILRFSTAGSVDDGKSTLIGRLLHDSRNVLDDHLSAIKRAAGKQEIGHALALLTDGLRAEREQGITIDVAYRYFATKKRRFILADSPGHEQYTRNMATGASTVDLTIILVDAERGITVQTRRHAFIASLLGVPRLLLTINKMDLVGCRQERFEALKDEFTAFASRLGIKELKFVPISALEGDNVVERSARMPWYQGETVMEYLENVYVGSDRNQVDFRFPVQCVVRGARGERYFAGRIRSGAIRVGEEVTLLPSKRRSRVRSIERYSINPNDRSLEAAFAPMSVAISIEDEIDTTRGDMLVRAHNVPHIVNECEAMVVWMNEQPMQLGVQYIVMHTSRETKARVEDIQYRINVNTLSRIPAQPLALNEVGRVKLTFAKPLFLDSYRDNRDTGNFVFIDPETFDTVGAGMVLDRANDSEVHAPNTDLGAKGLASGTLHREEGTIGRCDRERQFGAPARTVWFTGLSGSGKSTVAKALEQKLFSLGRPVYRLDGDNLRLGLNRDLGFSPEDRKENIRRVAEVAKLFNDAGISVLCSFISPYREDRARAREIIGDASFVEVFLSTPLAVCEARDPHGMYKRARAGEIQHFTGVSAPYDPPEAPALTVDTAVTALASCVEAILQRLST